MRLHRSWDGMALVALVIGVLVGTSCSTTPASPPAPGQPATETKPYGSLTVASRFGTGTLVDPASMAVAGGGTLAYLGAAIFDPLIDLAPDGQLKPGLAERWEISPDGMTHTFHIRKGVKFHDGSDLTGADVKFTIDSFLVGAPGQNQSPLWKGSVAKAELKDDYTVALQMKAPQFDLLTAMSNYQGDMPIVPKKLIEEKGWDYFGRNPIGSGPWKVVRFEPNARLELEAVETHWRAAPRFQKLTVLNVLEDATIAAMLKTGELDLALGISSDSVAGLKAAGLRVQGYYSSAQWYAAPFWDMSDPGKYALSDQRVRKALSLALDRKEVSSTMFGGYAQPSAAIFVPTTAYFFDPGVLKADPYDPDQAKRLLAEAGYAGGFSTKVWDPGGGGIMSTANLALAGYWRKIGVNAAVAAIDYATLGSKALVKPSPDMWNTFYTYISGGGTFGFNRMVLYHSKKSTFKNIDNPKLDELIDKVPMTSDAGEKKRLALEAAVMGKNEYNFIPGVDVDLLYAFGPKVGEVTPVKGINGLAASFGTITHGK
ncbi:MAG: ABC transporter substrate-binding protein [Chloroflexi bacterium]|nr:ABC transporter substrate-binding protein [Chloroflexota bacterium]